MNHIMNGPVIDNIIQYALLIAGQEDDYHNRQLGPIHLIKYVYLADLAFAEINNGKTLTEVEWNFHKFGPWSYPLHERIEPALIAARATKKTFPSNYPNKDDWTRWSLIDDHLCDTIERTLPLNVIARLRRDIRKFGSATPDLLHYVYSTKPMLHAAPGELLDFSSCAQPQHIEMADDLSKKQLTHKQKKKQKVALAALRQRNQKRLEEKRLKRKKALSVTTEQLYDDVYDEGLKWLNSLAGTPIERHQFDASFHNSIWKSPTRANDDVS